MNPALVLAITLGWVLVSAVGLGRSLPALRRARGDLTAVPPGQALARRQAARNLRLVQYRAACIAANLLVGLLALAGRADLIPAVVSAVIGTTLLCLVPALLALDADDHERHQDALEAAGTTGDAASLLAALGVTSLPGGRRRSDPPIPPDVDPGSHLR